jgi:hypothetical protein
MLCFRRWTTSTTLSAASSWGTEPVLQTGIHRHVLERLEMMRVCARRYMADVRRRNEGVAWYRPPQQKLTVVR